MSDFIFCGLNSLEQGAAGLTEMSSRHPGLFHWCYTDLAPGPNPSSALYRAFQVMLVVKNPPANAGDVRDAGLIPGSERSPEVVVVLVTKSCTTLATPQTV